VTPLPKKVVIIMPIKKKKEMAKEDRIFKEITRLNAIYKDLSEKEKDAIDGLIKRAAYMRITLEDMEADLTLNGFVEKFSQSDKTEPYEREQPVARLYNTINKNYQTIMKQLTEFVDREPPKQESDGFDEFVGEK
jgi:hypothetical protein